MNIVNFNIREAIPHPTFKGVLLCNSLLESEGLGLRSNFALIQPGCEISPHTHEVVEVFTILSGNPDVLYEGNWISVPVGTTIVAPPGEQHAVKNNSTTDVILQANFSCR